MWLGFLVYPYMRSWLYEVPWKYVGPIVIIMSAIILEKSDKSSSVQTPKAEHESNIIAQNLQPVRDVTESVVAPSDVSMSASPVKMVNVDAHVLDTEEKAHAANELTVVERRRMRAKKLQMMEAGQDRKSAEEIAADEKKAKEKRMPSPFERRSDYRVSIFEQKEGQSPKQEN